MERILKLSKEGAIVENYIYMYILLLLLSYIEPSAHLFFTSKYFLMISFSLLTIELILTSENHMRLRFLLMIFLSTIVMLINNSGIGSLIHYLLGIQLMVRGKKISLSRTKSHILLGVCVLMNAFVAYQSFSGYYTRFIANRTLVQMINPNHYGALIVYISTIFIIWIVKQKFSYPMLWSNFYLFFNLIVLYFLKTRASFLSLLIYILIFNVYIFYLQFDDYKIKRYLSFLLKISLLGVLLFPVVMSLLYLNFKNRNLLQSSALFFSKSMFSGREKIWSTFFLKLNSSIKNVLFGMGSRELFWAKEKKLNLHHSFINIYNNNGLFLFVFYLRNIYYSWFTNFKYEYNTDINSVSLIISLGIFPSIILGAFENTFSSFPYMMLYFIYYAGIKLDNDQLKGDCCDKKNIFEDA